MIQTFREWLREKKTKEIVFKEASESAYFWIVWFSLWIDFNSIEYRVSYEPIKSDLENRFIPDRSKVNTVKNKD